MKSMNPEVSSPDVILHFGAGNCSELEIWLAANPRRIVLVEPNPDSAKRLTAQARDHDRIHVIQQAVGDPGGSRRFRRFNIPALNSLREPTGLLELFPGLRTERELDVDAVAPVDLIESFELDPDGHHWLIIDTPGEEAAIVDSLHTAGQLASFERIMLHCGTDSLYQGNGPVDAPLDQLQKAGYDIEQRDDSDPDRPGWSLRRNPLRLENEALRREISDLEKETQELSQARDEQAKQVKERQQALEALEQDKQALEEKVAELEERAKELAEASDANAVLARQRQERVSELKTQLADMKERQRSSEEDIARAEGQIELIRDLVLRDTGL